LDQEPGKTRNPETKKNRERLWNGPECNNDIGDRRLKEQLRGSRQIKDLCGRLPLHLEDWKTTNGIYWKTIELEIVKGAVVGTPSGLRRTMDWSLRRGRPPPKRKKEIAHGVRAG
jgi:hypothetical protein